MKNNCLIILIAFLPALLFAQEEADTANAAKSSFSEKYNYLIRAKEEKTQLWKLTPVGSFAFGGGSGRTMFALSSYFGYERKLSRSFSINGEAGFNQYYSFGEGSNDKTFWLSGSLGPRYYYNINRRIRLGKSANNLSANYFSAMANFGVNGLAPGPSFSALYGLQRRIGDNFFIDLGIGPQIRIRQNSVDLLPDLRLRIGWAW
ncbi:MAG: hypothetical protein WD077_15220 [Bacteroidia bacterium]